MTPFAQILVGTIATSGPMPVAQWMARVLGDPVHGYYMTRDPLGTAGDFTTAPEISQMFGELIGLWFADLWLRAGQPHFRLVELGPGRGTLLADFWRATARVPGFHAAASLHLVETSPVLRAAQAQLLPHAHWHATLAEVPDDAPLLLVANEFFDALPIRQLLHTAEGWRERLVSHDGAGFAPGAGALPLDALVPAALADAAIGAVWETSPAGAAIAAEIGARLARQGGAALIIDYGYSGPACGDTLQAVRAHRFADPFAAPGEADLTAHVDFAALAAAAGTAAHGPVGQGDFLVAIGLALRAEALKALADTTARAHIDAAVARLTLTMGALFKVLALTGNGWPTPAGFGKQPA
ncbi:MAG: class I SAM-dependent methyltransferase [Polymorphobacter sp.]